MSTTKSFRLKENAREFVAGNYIGFGFSFGKKRKGKNGQPDVWTNYEGAIFASSTSQPQLDYYRKIMVAGSVLCVTARSEEIDIQESNGKQYHKIKMMGCELEGGYEMVSQQQVPVQQPQSPQQPVQQVPVQQQPQSAPQPATTVLQGKGFDDFDDDIPFANPYQFAYHMV